MKAFLAGLILTLIVGGMAIAVENRKSEVILIDTDRDRDVS